MKKLIAFAAFVLAFAPFAQAQNASSPLAGHPDARNDRSPSESAVQAPAKRGAKHVKQARQATKHQRSQARASK
jgi:hypothetical protein